ncbi:MAG: HNH endonuclease [Xenococcaceae cyanobacterium MO_234.B1]|nr:HNH endonuclease [Xenococcaceae cyanobacterium MO_234.B1]
MWKIPPVSRKNLLRRDAHQCQYCGNGKHLTIDHIIPRSKGGKHSWNNVVIACAVYNSRKGNKTPQEAGMTLESKPKAPIQPTVAFAEQFWQQQNLNINQE